MKMLKVIKIAASVISVGSVLGITSNLISCGHKDSTPPKDDEPNWKEFKFNATRAAVISIVKGVSSGINGWDSNNWNDFKFVTKPVSDDHSQTIMAVIRSDSQNDQATFLVAYSSQWYKDDLWKCSVQPPSYQVGWNAFKKAAKSDETAAKLLAQARSSKVLDGFKWTYGDPSQTKWSQYDVAQWDTFGSRTWTKDTYKGMDGTIKVNEKDHSISGIMSRKGKAGNYDADPIKVKITYSDGVVYNIKNWKFSQTEQLQSYENVKYLFDIQVDIVKENQGDYWGLFLNKDWATIGDNTKAINHSSDNNINQILKETKNKHGYPCYPFFRKGGGNQNPIFKNNPIVKQTTQISMKMIFDFSIFENKTQQTPPYQLSLYFNFVFANGKNTDGGGTAFNYTWIGYVTP